MPLFLLRARTTHGRRSCRPSAWLILAIILGTHAATVVELFPTRTRQTGLSIAYALTAALFAGTAPYILTWLIDTTGSTLSPGWFLAVVGVIGIVTVASLPETRGINLLHSDDIDEASNSVDESAAPAVHPTPPPVEPSSDR